MRFLILKLIFIIKFVFYYNSRKWLKITNHLSCNFYLTITIMQQNEDLILINTRKCFKIPNNYPTCQTGYVLSLGHKNKSQFYHLDGQLSKFPIIP